ncbi:hypothetical protein [Sorangium sp. So ce204]|uniref:hypothetical protein n=1 Tax=Sorangium sp. So ce204 TaxID=3133288 RepID=UPI003F64470F
MDAAGAQRAADERALFEERGGVEVDGGVKRLVMGLGRAEPAARRGARPAA